MPDGGTTPGQATVASLAELYLGNLLYSLEVTAMTLQAQEKLEDAAFYRGIARELADAHGRSAGRTGPGPGPRTAGDGLTTP